MEIVGQLRLAFDMTKINFFILKHTFHSVVTCKEREHRPSHKIVVLQMHNKTRIFLVEV